MPQDLVPCHYVAGRHGGYDGSVGQRRTAHRATGGNCSQNTVAAWLGAERRVFLLPDDVLISVERPLSLDSPGQMVASILSKKIAAGSSHLVLDIPIGPTAKVRSMPEAQRLRRLFEYVARRIQLSLDVVITDGRQPIGFGIGPVLEARDVMRVLENDRRRPSICAKRPCGLAGRLIECDPDVRGGDGFCHRSRYSRLRARVDQDARHHRSAGQQVL